MKKGIVTGVAFIAVLATLTGCAKTKKLTCTITNDTDDGFSTSEEIVYKFKDNKVSTAKVVRTISVEKTYEKYFDTYKDSANDLAEKQNKLSGVKSKVETSSNKVVITTNYTIKDLSDDLKKANDFEESYESMKSKKTEQKYTCK